MAAFIYRHFFQSNFHAPDVDLSGKTAVITGSNAGLGYEGAKHLARNNVSLLVLAVRDTAKGEAAAKQLKSEIPSWEGKAEVWKLDMASFASVKDFAERLDTLDRLDILLLNAGVFHLGWKTTPDGWESTLQVNVLATGLLALLALPKLAATADLVGNKYRPHLVIVASDVHEWAKFPQQDAPTLLAALNDKSQADFQDTYNMSKLLDIFMTREIAQLPLAQKVIVNTLTPGLCVSALRTDLPAIVARILNWIAWSAERGTRNYLYAATQETPQGAYISQCKLTPPSNFVLSEKGQKIQKKLWGELTEFWLGEAPQVAKVIN